MGTRPECANTSWSPESVTTLQRGILCSPITVDNRLQPRFLAAWMTACLGMMLVIIVIYQCTISPVLIP